MSQSNNNPNKMFISRRSNGNISGMNNNLPSNNPISSNNKLVPSISSRPTSSSSNSSNEKEGNKLYNNNHYQIISNSRNLNSKLSKPAILKTPTFQKQNLMDNHLQKKIVSEISKRKVPNDEIDTVEEDDVTSSIIGRLKKLEQLVSEQRTTINLKDSNIKELVKKLDKEKDKSTKLQQNLNLIINYLNNKGISHPFQQLLENKKEEEKTLYEGNWNRQESIVENDEDIGPKLNMKLIESKINELNQLVDEEQITTIKNNGNIKQLKPKETCKIIFWKNGVSIGDGPFRPYKWDLTKAFLTDILDGYFPYEFKEKHPEGVKLLVENKTNQHYSKEVEKSIKLDNYLKAHDGNIKGVEYLKFIEENKGNIPQVVDKKTLLENLPKTVLKNGKLIPIRDEVRKMFSSDKNNNDFTITSPEIQTLDDANICVLKVKSSNSSQCTVHALKTHTIGHVKSLLEEQFNRQDIKLKVFPNTTLEDDDKTLEELSLFPKAVLILL
ncbi:hypothetical protein ABK040_002891 [Willaertia magna]